MLLAEDGRHVWLGRHSDPTDDEVASAGMALDGQGLAGWLTVTKGDYWARKREPELLVVRRVTQRHGDERAAADLWRKARQERLSELQG
jgi:hypothetical protein